MADEIIKKQITKEGYDELQNELSERKTKKRSEIAARIEDAKARIEDAKAQGDLSENSEYDEARAEQAENETRIEELEAILKAVEVVDDSNLSTDKVSLGSTVTLQNTATKQEYKYKLVGESEIDFKKKRISENSPVGRAISNQKKGKTVSVSTPSGIIKYKIIKIEK